MPNLRARRLALTDRPNKFRMNDEFSSAHVAGAGNGTPIDGLPLGDFRTDVDTASLISNANDKMVVASGKGTPSNGDPGRWWKARARTVGMVLVFEFNMSIIAAKTHNVGWDTDQTLGINGYAITVNGTSNLRVTDGSDQMTVGAALALATSYKFAIALNSTGAQVFGYGGIYTYPQLLWPCINLTTTPLYPAVSNNSASYTLDFVRIIKDDWLARPLLSDGFANAFGTLDGLGHMDAATALGNGGGGGSWTQVGTWATSAGVANASVLSGGLAFAYKNAGTKDVFLSVDITRSAANVGLVARYADSNNYLIAYHDGTNVKLDQVLAGVTTNLISGVIAYSAGKKLRLELDGNNAQLFFNQARTASATAVINAGLTATNHGLFTTDTGNTFDNFYCFATGTAGEYAGLTDFF